MGADVFTVGSGVGTTSGCHVAFLFMDDAFGEGFEVEFDELSAMPEVGSVVGGADNAAGTTFGI